MIEQYKKYLDIGTNEGLRYNDESKSRFVSFNLCLEYLKKLPNPKVLELGTCRSFVDGKLEGCNSDDPKYWNKDDISTWDFGAGCFSLIFGKFHFNLTSVDLASSHIRRCKMMTDSLGISCHHIVSDSVSYLKNCGKKFDLIYLDTGDMWPIEMSESLQLEEAKMIVELGLLEKGGLILIDDVLNGTPREQGDMNNKWGKSTLSLPYLLENGFKVLYEGYQVLLGR